jgi:hypothetical protein
MIEMAVKKPEQQNVCPIVTGRQRALATFAAFESFSVISCGEEMNVHFNAMVSNSGDQTDR